MAHVDTGRGGKGRATRLDFARAGKKEGEKGGLSRLNRNNRNRKNREEFRSYIVVLNFLFSSRGKMRGRKKEKGVLSSPPHLHRARAKKKERLESVLRPHGRRKEGANSRLSRDAKEKETTTSYCHDRRKRQRNGLLNS